MKRSLNPAPFNVIANHPEVFPWLGFPEGLGEADLSQAVVNPRNFCFLTPNEDGGYIVIRLQAGLYAAHTLATPEARGKPMLRLMRESFRAMFTETDAIEITTLVPDGNEAAKSWADVAGFRNTFRREAFFPLGGEFVGGQYRSLSWQEWAMCDPENLALGRMFHGALQGLRSNPHPEDVTHDRFVGAALGTCKGGNVEKGINLYNRWAVTAGYNQAAILSMTPPLVDIGDAIVSLNGNELDVLQVRN